MKKTLIILLAVVVLLAASGCSKKKEGASEASAPADRAEAAQVETAGSERRGRAGSGVPGPAAG